MLFSELFENYGYLTYSADRHTCEFFSGYLHSKELMEKFKLVRTTTKERREGIKKSREYAKRLAAGKEKIQPPSCETAVDIMKAFITNTPFVDVVNLPNVGQIDNLPRGAVVETLGLVDSAGFAPIAVGPLPDTIQKLTDVHCHVQKMTLEAALTGNRKLALQSLLLDPLCSHLPQSKVVEMGLTLMEATKDYLPQFN